MEILSLQGNIAKQQVVSLLSNTLRLYILSTLFRIDVKP